MDIEDVGDDLPPGHGRIGLDRALDVVREVCLAVQNAMVGPDTSLALTVTLRSVARARILVRNPVALESAATIRRIVFDKAGTLTHGWGGIRDWLFGSIA
jgi:P-type E1-E2 ATPase